MITVNGHTTMKQTIRGVSFINYGHGLTSVFWNDLVMKEMLVKSFPNVIIGSNDDIFLKDG